MHELSIALNIVELVEEEMARHKGEKVDEIVLEIGRMSGVVPDAMEFALEEAVKSTVLEYAKRKIEYLGAIARCSNCGKDYALEDYFSPCPDCTSFEHEIIQGKELKIKSIIISQNNNKEV
jgi:hydrogenase nickel incorporation protein HypA/HybF